MEKILIFIKHNFEFLWRIIEWGNGIVFSVLYGKIMAETLPGVFKDSANTPFQYRKLDVHSAESLYDLIQSQQAADLKYFSPHGFDLISIKNKFSKPDFLMMGVYDNNKLIGYFFLRFFANKKCFVGRLIDREYRGKGIGLVMNTIMYETAWRMGFRCLSTISKNNTSVIKAHKKNASMVVLKELRNDYLLVEFVREKGEVIGN